METPLEFNRSVAGGEEKGAAILRRKNRRDQQFLAEVSISEQVVTFARTFYEQN